MGQEVWAAVEIAGEAMIAAMQDEETASRALAFDLETLAELEFGEFPKWGLTVDPDGGRPARPVDAAQAVAANSPRPNPPTRNATPQIRLSNRTMQALERIDALQLEIEDDDPGAGAKKQQIGLPEATHQISAPPMTMWELPSFSNGYKRNWNAYWPLRRRWMKSGFNYKWNASRSNRG